MVKANLLISIVNLILWVSSEVMDFCLFFLRELLVP